MMMKTLPYFAGLFVLLAAASFLMGLYVQAERQRDIDARETIGIHEDLNNADVSTGDSESDAGWLRDWLGPN